MQLVIPLLESVAGGGVGSDGKFCLVAQGIYKGLRNYRAFFLIVPLYNLVVSPVAIYLSFKFEASIPMARMTGLKEKNKLKTKYIGAKEASILFAHPLAIYNTKEKYPFL